MNKKLSNPLQEQLIYPLFMNTKCLCALVAQLDRVPDYESGGRRFDSFRAYHFFLRSFILSLNVLVRLNFLILGLFLVGYTMYSLSHDGLPQSVTSIFGVESKKSNDYLTWCDTRAKTVILNDSISLFQKGKSWHAKVGVQEKRIDAIAMEKWFSNYCRLNVKFLKNRPQKLVYSNQLGIQFVNGAQASFQKSSKLNIFKWQTKYFESQNLEKAIKDLKQLIK